MIAAVDVCYGVTDAVAACILFRSFADEAPVEVLLSSVGEVEPYEPGAFYRRELPCLLAVLGLVKTPLTAVVIDGYVWLSHDRRPGLGAHLHESLGGAIPVIGVAKTGFAGADFAVPVLRGESAKPLFVTAIGMDSGIAADWIREMHGEYRVPALLRQVDQACRGRRS
jgi:deoxyribonuclease V